MHYGGDKTDNLMLMAQHDVVLTTYGVLSAAYKAVGVCHLPFASFFCVCLYIFGGNKTITNF